MPDRPSDSESENKLTPIFGLGIQGMGYVNTSASKTAFDASEVSLLGKVNLMNLFGGYMGEPRIFWNRDSDRYRLATLLSEWPRWYKFLVYTPWSKLELQPRWGKSMDTRYQTSYRIWYARRLQPKLKAVSTPTMPLLKLTAGLTYHFMCSNGSHHFTTVKPYDPVEVGELNNAVNRLRSQLSDKDMQLSNAVQQANNLQKELADCRTQAMPT